MLSNFLQGVPHVMARMVHCVKLNKDAPGLPYPPVPGELGKRIWAQVSATAADESPSPE